MFPWRKSGDSNPEKQFLRIFLTNPISQGKIRKTATKPLFFFVYSIARFDHNSYHKRRGEAAPFMVSFISLQIITNEPCALTTILTIDKLGALGNNASKSAEEHLESSEKRRKSSKEAEISLSVQLGW